VEKREKPLLGSGYTRGSTVICAHNRDYAARTSGNVQRKIHNKSMDNAEEIVPRLAKMGVFLARPYGRRQKINSSTTE
jgi:CRISPR/Cas system CSM-associated protein Csm2 small subunit